MTLPEPPPRRTSHKTQPRVASHVTGRYRSDGPQPMQRGLSGRQVRIPGCLIYGGVLLAVILTAAIVTLGVLIVVSLPAAPQANNAIWLGIDWGANLHSDAEVENLARLLQTHGIGTIYVWTTWLQEDAAWSATTFANLGAFVQQLRRFYPQVVLYAWIGVPVDVPVYRLDDAEIRAEVAAFCSRVIGEYGFDGIHLNTEPVWSEDSNYPALLREIRQQLANNVLLSVAVPPDWNTGTPGIPAGPLTVPGAMWSEEYKQRIALLVNEIAVMAYNSGLSSPADYQAWMAFQVTQFVSAVAAVGVETELVIGVPTYDAELPGHDPAAENIPAAIAGVRQGLAQSGSDAALVRGLGIYAYWSTDAQEWNAYRELWIEQPGR